MASTCDGSRRGVPSPANPQANGGHGAQRSPGGHNRESLCEAAETAGRTLGKDAMHAMLTSPLLASIIHGTATPILWVIGIILIVAGVVAIFRTACLWEWCWW